MLILNDITFRQSFLKKGFWEVSDICCFKHWGFQWTQQQQNGSIKILAWNFSEHQQSENSDFQTKGGRIRGVQNTQLWKFQDATKNCGYATSENPKTVFV